MNTKDPIRTNSNYLVQQWNEKYPKNKVNSPDDAILLLELAEKKLKRQGLPHGPESIKRTLENYTI